MQLREKDGQWGARAAGGLALQAAEVVEGCSGGGGVPLSIISLPPFLCPARCPTVHPNLHATVPPVPLCTPARCARGMPLLVPPSCHKRAPKHTRGCRLLRCWRCARRAACPC